MMTAMFLSAEIFESVEIRCWRIVHFRVDAQWAASCLLGWFSVCVVSYCCCFYRSMCQLANERYLRKKNVDSRAPAVDFLGVDVAL